MRSRNKAEGGECPSNASALVASPTPFSTAGPSSQRGKRFRQDRIGACVPIIAMAVLMIVFFQLCLNPIHHNETPAAAAALQLQQQIARLEKRTSQMEQERQLQFQPGFPTTNNRNNNNNNNTNDSKHNNDKLPFLSFVIRDARHLVVSPGFHSIFDCVDTSAPQQDNSGNSLLFHNAHPLEKAPCQKYSVECYRLKTLQVFCYVLEHFPHAQCCFCMEADNDLCVPMRMVQKLALTEKRCFINVGIGFSGWIMSRQFLQDFFDMCSNITVPTARGLHNKPETRPDVVASICLANHHAWTVTRQHWVSHTTLESLGASSLTVKDRRKSTRERMKLDKHLPRCFEPRQGKWVISKVDPRDRFGWDHFDCDVCPDSAIFPCNGQHQLAELAAKDWATANRTGAIKIKERSD